MNSAIALPTFENVLYEKRDRIAYVTLNRPKVLNALNKKTLAELSIVFEDAGKDGTIQGVILAGSGYRAFIAGADIGELANLRAVEAERLAQYGQAVFNLVENLGKPVIAAVHGFVLGSGCEAAMACTFRLAPEGARFGLPEVKFGILPCFGGTQWLPRLVGKGLALQLILTGEIISAQEAYRIGLINEVVPTEHLIPRAEAILNQIRSNAPLAIKFAIEAVNKGLETSQAEGLVLESSLFAICAATEDKKEDTSAFLEERVPQFQGR
jgi:enoyl-CoA hydratase/carnithine racemase